MPSWMQNGWYIFPLLLLLLKFLILLLLWVFCLCSFDVCSLNLECLQKLQVMVTLFGCCCVNGRGAPQSPNCWRSCKVLGKMREGEMEDHRGMVLWRWRVCGTWVGWGCWPAWGWELGCWFVYWCWW